MADRLSENSSIRVLVLEAGVSYVLVSGAPSCTTLDGVSIVCTETRAYRSQSYPFSVHSSIRRRLGAGIIRPCLKRDSLGAQYRIPEVDYWAEAAPSVRVYIRRKHHSTCDSQNECQISLSTRAALRTTTTAGSMRRAIRVGPGMRFSLILRRYGHLLFFDS